MKTVLAIGVAAAALMGASSAANAQDCVGGWMMIKDQIPVRCDTLPSAFEGPGVVDETAAIEEPLPVEEPIYTGSIDTGVPPVSESEQPPQPGGPGYVGMAFVGSADECQPGYFYMMELNSGNRPVACE